MAERVAFSKSISLDLLNEAYEEFISGITKKESTAKLDEIIGQSITSKVNIKQTRIIVQNVWFNNIDWLHNEAVEIARYLSRVERLPVHWAIMLVRFSIFADLCAVLGYLFEYKDSVSAAQIKEEIYNKWGARTTLDASLSKNLKSMRDMGVLERADKYTSYAKITTAINDPKVVAILFAAVMLATEQQYMTWDRFISHPAIFPFAICNVTQADMASISYLTMERMGDNVVFRIKNIQ